MTFPKAPSRSRLFWFIGGGAALILAVIVSPFASPDPDGLDRVAEDLEFNHQAQEETIASDLPFAQVFDEYSVQGLPDGVATSLAGLIGTLVTFGLAWGLGKILIAKPASAAPNPSDLP